MVKKETGSGFQEHSTEFKRIVFRIFSAILTSFSADKVNMAEMNFRIISEVIVLRIIDLFQPIVVFRVYSFQPLSTGFISVDLNSQM